MQVLYITKVWPEPNSTAAGWRSMQLIELLLNEGWKLHIASVATIGDYSVAFNNEQIGTSEIAVNDDNFNTLLESLKPEIVIYDRYVCEEQFGWRVSEVCSEALTIIDTQDLNGLREARYLAHNANREVVHGDYTNDIALRELASIQRCDLALIISAFEFQFAQEVYGIAKSKLSYFPFLFNANLKSLGLLFENRAHFYTIGNFHHAPNVDSVLFLKKEIWPLIRMELPKAQLHVYGAYQTEHIIQLHNEKEGFVVKGRTENANEVAQQYKACLAPLRFGAGLKGKLFEAMLNGTPSVTTNLGAEGMHGSLNWAGAIANDSKSFAQAAVEMYSNQELWKQHQDQGLKILNECFQATLFTSTLINTVKKKLNDLDAHRIHDTNQAAFNHQSLKSTMYLSKWIMEKNKS